MESGCVINELNNFRDQQQPHPLLLVKYSTASATSSSTLQHPLYLDRHFHMDIAKVYHSHLVQLGMISLHGGGHEKEEEDEKEKRGRRRRELLDEELVEKPPAAAASSSSAAAAIAMDEEVLDVVVLEEEKMNRNVDGPRQQHQQQTLTFSSSVGDDAWLML